jgi:hypothetical protein
LKDVENTRVTSIQRLNNDTGSFETASFKDGVPAGFDFPVVQGEGYIVFMKQVVEGFRPGQ